MTNLHSGPTANGYKTHLVLKEDEWQLIRRTMMTSRAISNLARHSSQSCGLHQH